MTRRYVSFRSAASSIRSLPLYVGLPWSDRSRGAPAVNMLTADAPRQKHLIDVFLVMYDELFRDCCCDSDVRELYSCTNIVKQLCLLLDIV